MAGSPARFHGASAASTAAPTRSSPYLTESALLTAGTLRAEPASVMADGQGHVAVPVRLRASRPDGRTMDGPQVVLVTVEGGRVRAIEQFVGDPAAVAAFWA